MEIRCNSLVCKEVIPETTQELQKQVDALQKKVDTLTAQFAVLKALVERLLYAPGMPGYLEARASFEREVERQTLLP